MEVLGAVNKNTNAIWLARSMARNRYTVPVEKKERKDMTFVRALGLPLTNPSSDTP